MSLVVAVRCDKAIVMASDMRTPNLYLQRSIAFKGRPLGMDAFVMFATGDVGISAAMLDEMEQGIDAAIGGGVHEHAAHVGRVARKDCDEVFSGKPWHLIDACNPAYPGLPMQFVVGGYDADVRAKIYVMDSRKCFKVESFDEPFGAWGDRAVAEYILSKISPHNPMNVLQGLHLASFAINESAETSNARNNMPWNTIVYPGKPPMTVRDLELVDLVLERVRDMSSDISKSLHRTLGLPRLPPKDQDRS